MNMNQFTQKSLAAIQGAQDIATEHGNQQIEQEHLLLALLSDEQGFIPQLLSAMGMTVPSFTAAVTAQVEKLPKVSGGSREAGQVYIAQDVDKALKSAESTAQSMKDEYISVEHIFLGLLDCANRSLKELFRTYNVTKEKVMQALASVRGNQRVTSDNPEETYDALKKYGTDLVERARQNKLDPVIGRDDEIRNVVRPHRRARRGQDRHRRGSGPANRQGRRAQFSEGQDHLLPGHGQPDCGRQVPGRV